MNISLKAIKAWSERQLEAAREKELSSPEPGLGLEDIEDPQFRDIALRSIGVNGPKGRIGVGQVGHEIGSMIRAAEKFDADGNEVLDDDELDKLGHVYPGALRLAIFAKQGDKANKASPKDSAVRGFFRNVIAEGRTVRTADVLQMTKGRRLTETQSEGLAWLMHLKPEIFAKPDPSPGAGTHYSGSGFLPFELYANPSSAYQEPYPSDAAAEFLKGLVELPKSPEHQAFSAVHEILGRDDLQLKPADANAIMAGAFGLGPEVMEQALSGHSSQKERWIVDAIQRKTGVSLKDPEAKLSYFGNAWSQVFDACAMLVDSGFELCPPLQPSFANAMVDWGEKVPKGLKIPITASITGESVDAIDRDPQRMMALFDLDNDGLRFERGSQRARHAVFCAQPWRDRRDDRGHRSVWPRSENDSSPGPLADHGRAAR